MRRLHGHARASVSTVHVVPIAAWLNGLSGLHRCDRLVAAVAVVPVLWCLRNWLYARRTYIRVDRLHWLHRITFRRATVWITRLWLAARYVLRAHLRLWIILRLWVVLRLRVVGLPAVTSRLILGIATAATTADASEQTTETHLGDVADQVAAEIAAANATATTEAAIATVATISAYASQVR